MAREIHGPEFDPSTADLEGDIVMRLGPGKPHGRYYMGNSTIDTANTQTLAQIRARSTSSSPAIRPRSQPQVVALQAQIEALQESQQASQSQFQALQLSHQAELAQERARVQAQLEAFQQSQKAWYEYMASFSLEHGPASTASAAADDTVGASTSARRHSWTFYSWIEQRSRLGLVSVSR
ncbi:uncharacterized protein [Miscanthus floridulus]|uniref:uncharacterized protein n=1 Tax=Miscanthus floridulus TaxID=154761 RepID=UPI0034584FDE